MTAILIALAILAFVIIVNGVINMLRMSKAAAVIFNIITIIIMLLIIVWIGFKVFSDEEVEQQTIIEEEEIVAEKEQPVEELLSPEDVPAPLNVLTDKEIEQKYNYSIILSKYGIPEYLNDHSLRVRMSERYDATKLFDAVTYTEATEEEKMEEGWIEQFVYDEVRSNPVYASGVFLALQEIGVIGNEDDDNMSDWSKAYNENREKIFYWVGDLSADKIDALNDGEEVSLPLSAEYNEYASYMVELLHGAANKGIHSTSEGWKVLKMYGLDPDNEKIIESTKTDKYPFWVFEFVWKDGTVKYIGINTIDFRLLILDPPSTYPKPTPKPTPQPTPQPNPDPNPDPDPGPTPTKDPDQRPGDHNDEPDDTGTGDLEPTEPAWPKTPTVKVGDDTSDRKDTGSSDPVIDPSADVIDQNKPDDSPIPKADTDYADGSSKTDPINDGTVDPF